MTQDPLQTPIQFVAGVGPKRAELLEKLELRTVADILYRLPRDVLDLTQVTPVDQLTEGPVHTVRGKVLDRESRELANRKTLSAVLLECGHKEFVRGVWFNQPWMLHKFRDYEMVLFSGKCKQFKGRWEMSHPRVQVLDADDATAHGGMLPRYSLTDGLKMHEMRRIVRKVVEEFAPLVPDPLPESYRKQEKLIGLSEAIQAVHLPANPEHYAAGRFRLIFDDLLEFQLALGLRRRAWKLRNRAPGLVASAKVDARIRRLLPFSLTNGQEQAVREICADLESGHAMHRLLQADVGAGKTVVAIYAMLVTVAAGYQAALMTPTELLATQHWQTLDRLLANSRVQRALLTGDLTAAQRRITLAGVNSGELQLVVGTQALIQKDVAFGKLGLIVIDEQHKFGVVQRAKFAGGDSLPHTLVMTATPIPRSLCLTQFGDLDLSVMKELPPGRQKIWTSRVLTEATRKKAWQFIREKLKAGRQAYIVCPRIEGTEADASALETFQRLSTHELAGFRVGLLHGQMPPAEKAAAMDAFRAGETQALVSTTVVEVGVDVPNATLMLIQQAERFGLSQLHQLRGRVGRGQFQGYCFLFTGTAEDDALERLQALEKHASGFDVAEADFQIRGPGDILGTRQHGELPLRVADLARDQDVLLLARTSAFQLVDSGTFDSPEFAPLKQQVLTRFGQLFDLAGSG